MVNNYQAQTDFRRRQRLLIWCTSIIISHLSTTHSKDSVIYFSARLTLMFCSFIDKVYWVWPASHCNKSWQIVFFIYIIHLACSLFFQSIRLHILFPEYGTIFARQFLWVPAGVCFWSQINCPCFIRSRRSIHQVQLLKKAPSASLVRFN